MSPSIWFGGARLFDYVASAAGAPRPHLPRAGPREGVGTLRNARALNRLLRRKGYRKDS